MEALRNAPKSRLGTVGNQPVPDSYEELSADSPSAQPWQRREDEWECLTPSCIYARYLRTPLLYGASLCCLPLAVLLALPVALANFFAYGSLGKILFRQERIGRRGKAFVIFKFRTMLDDESIPDHERVTRLGRFLRNTHLDELPQFINVLRGEMCLIGPRPEMSSVEGWAARVHPRFSERLVLRPGITGWAQITQGYAAGGDSEAYHRKLVINRVYRARLSFGTDAMILVRTVAWMLLRRGWKPKELFVPRKEAELKQAA